MSLGFESALDESPVKKQNGRVEKIFSTYGFIMDSQQSRYFFHFGKCVTKPEMLQAGDQVEFVLGVDAKTNRVHAQQVQLVQDRSSSSSPVLSKSTSVSSTGSSPSLSPSLFCDPSALSVLCDLLTKSCIGTPMSTQGVVVVAPDDYNEGAMGTVAFAMSGQTLVAEFAWRALKFPQERSLIKFGTVVDMVVTMTGSCSMWQARQVLPNVPEVQGVIISVNTQSAVIDLANQRRRVLYPLRFYTGSDKSAIQPGASVQFILVSSPKGEIATRMRVLESGAVSISRVSSQVSFGQLVLAPDQDGIGYVEYINEKGLRQALPFYKEQLSQPAAVGDWLQFHLQLDVRDSSRSAVQLSVITR